MRRRIMSDKVDEIYLEEQEDGSQKMYNGYGELLGGYSSLEVAIDRLKGLGLIGPPYKDIGGFTMREVKTV